MAEQIDIAQLNWDTSKLTKNIIDVRTQMDNMRESLKETRKEIRNNIKETSDLEKEQKELAKTEGKDSDRYKQISKDLETLKDNREKLTKVVVQEEASLKSLSAEQRTLNNIIKATQKSNIENTAVAEQATAMLNKQWHTQQEAVDIGKALITMRKNLNPEIKEEAELMDQLRERINEANEFQKLYNTENEKRVKNIGLYEDAINQAAEGTKLFGGATAGVIPNIRGVTQSVKAFMAIPLVAVITLIVAGITYLVKQFSATQEGMDAITRVSRPFMAVLNTINRIVGDLAVQLFNAFKNPQQALKDLVRLVGENLMNRLTSFKVVLEGIINLDFKKIGDGILQGVTGVENMTDRMKEYADQVGEAIDLGLKLDDTIKKRENLQVGINKAQSEANLQINQITESMRDSNLQWEKRAELADQRLAIQEGIAKQQQDIIDLEIQEARIREEINGRTSETQKEINDLIAKRIDIENQTQSLRVRNQRYISQAQKEAQQANEQRLKEMQEQALAEKNIALERFKLMKEGRAEDLKEELDFQKQVSEMRLEILEQEYQNGKKSKEEYELEKQKIALESARGEAEAIISYSEDSLNKQILDLQNLQEERGRITDETLAEETQRINQINEQQLENAKTALDAGILTRQEYNNRIFELEQDKNEKLKQLNTDFAIQQKEDEDLRLMLESEQRLLDIQDRFERERELRMQLRDEDLARLEEEREAGKISEENYLRSIEIINQKAADRIGKIDQKRFQNKLRLASDSLADMADIFGQETETGKFFASAKALIDTYAAANLALATYPPPFSYIAAATTIGTGLKNVAEINKTKTDFYTGGYTGDGGMFSKRGNVHAGEVVFNQADVMRLGGPVAVDSMRPTSENFTRPTGIGSLVDTDHWDYIASVLGDNVRRGANQGTNDGIVQANDDNEIKQKAIF